MVTVFLGPYLTAVARAAADARGFVHPLGVRIAAGSFFPYVVSLSVMLQVVLGRPRRRRETGDRRQPRHLDPAWWLRLVAFSRWAKVLHAGTAVFISSRGAGYNAVACQQILT